MNNAQTIVRLLLGSFSLRNAPAPIQIHTKTPCGIPSKAVCRVLDCQLIPLFRKMAHLNPNPLMTKVLKFEIPPLGMLPNTPSNKNAHDL
jgi:hypothetical protein